VTWRPIFTLPSSTGGNVSLRDFRGKKVVLYFYPADDTPGCTKEACGFRDAYADIQATGAAVLGVSKDRLDSHHKFSAKYSLPFPLLSDPETAVIKAYGAYGMKNLYGKISEGTLRHTLLIDEEGRIAKVWRRVRTEVHAAEVLEALCGASRERKQKV
jgi:peroxiredoxin Q/BCP